MKIAHIINPVKVNEKSDLYKAQPVTFETMNKAKQFASLYEVNVELYYTCFKEDIGFNDDGFKQAKLLNKSVLDVNLFNEKRKLPLLKNILESLYDATDADYLIYTNVDIALMPSFYVSVKKIIDSGYDAFAINRRTISDQYSEIKDIPLMYSEIGEAHPGFDCFVFKRDVFPKYILNNSCIGINWIGTVLLWNLEVFSSRFKVFEDLHLTFHIGNDKTWKNPKFSDYVKHNKNEAKKIYSELQSIDNTFSDKRHERLLND